MQGSDSGGGRSGVARTLELMERFVLIGQGLFYVATGIWSLVSIGSFQQVTGPKVDTWLVKTVGLLVIVIGGVVALAGLRRRVTPEVELLAAGSALGLTAIDAVYTGKGRISKVYLLDAAAEVATVAALAAAHRMDGREVVARADLGDA